MALAAEKAFLAHDWDADKAWQSRLAQIFIANGVDHDTAIAKLKRKYYQSDINEELSLTPTSEPPVSSSKQQSGTLEFNRRVLIGSNYVRLGLYSLNILLGIGYLMSFSSGSYFCFKYMMVSSLLGCFLHIGITYGKPKFNVEFAQLLFVDEETHFILMYLAMIMCSPMLLPVINVMVRSSLFVASSLDNAILPMYSPTLHAKASPFLNMVIIRKFALCNWLATVDLAIGFVFLFELLSSSRQLLVLMIFWQYLRIRYMFSSAGRQAFQRLGATLDSWLLSSRSPAIVQTAYRKVQSYAYSLVDPEQAKTRQSQYQNSRCNVM